MAPTILFLCPHGAAKSILAAAYFEQAAAQHDLKLHVEAAGTEPDPAVSPVVAGWLAQEGLAPWANRTPRLVRAEEIGRAWRVVSLGCDLDHLVPTGTIIDHWDNVPAPSQHLRAACDLIRHHVAQLIAELRHE